MANPFEEMIDEELTLEYMREAERLSFHNAADGEQYHNETASRHRCIERFSAIKAAMQARNLDFPKGDWLL